MIYTLSKFESEEAAKSLTEHLQNFHRLSSGLGERGDGERRLGSKHVQQQIKINIIGNKGTKITFFCTITKKSVCALLYF